MSKLEQVLDIQPSAELRFRGPFNEVVSSDLKLTNPSDKRVCFKVKTTAPKRYCVRPNSGIIEPNGHISVQVMLQPFEYDPNEKNKHKFMVQTMYAPEGKIENQETLWKEATPNQLMDSKLRCVFDMPASGTETGTIQQPTVQEDKVKPVINQEIKQEYNAPVSHSPLSSVIKNSNLPDAENRYEEEVKKLKNEIASLKEENSMRKEAEVRLRKVAMSDTVTSTPTPSAHPQDMSTKSSSLPPYLYLIVAFILGIIIGKLIL